MEFLSSKSNVISLEAVMLAKSMKISYEDAVRRFAQTDRALAEFKLAKWEDIYDTW